MMANWFHDIHRADGRSETYADTAENAVKVKGDKETCGGYALLEKQELRDIAAESRKEEENAGDGKRALAAEIRSEEA